MTLGFLKRITSRIDSVNGAAFLLSIFALLSQIFALFRDRLLASNFGTSSDLDVYYAAFKIPDLIFATVASIVSISVLVPLFAKKETEGHLHMKEAMNSIFTTFSLVIIFSSVIAWFLMPNIIRFLFSNFDNFYIEHTIKLSRLLLLSPLLLGFSNFFGSVVQYEKRFILYSLSPILYNIGILFGIIFFSPYFGIEGVIYGVILGALMHLCVQATFVFLSPLRPKIVFNIDWNLVLNTTKTSIPRTLALSVTSFVALFFSSFASRFGEGSVSIINLASNLQSVPLSLIGVSLSVASFPSISLSVAKNNIDKVIYKISDGLQNIIFWSIPITVIIILLRAHIVRIVLGAGYFDWSATRMSAAVLALFILSTVFQSISLFLSRSHYALGNTKLPLIGNILGGVVSVLFSFVFIYFINLKYDVLYLLATALKVSDLRYSILFLPLVFSFGNLTSSLFLFFSLPRQYVLSIVPDVYSVSKYSIVASIFSGLTVYASLFYTSNFFDMNTFIGVVSHASIAFLFGIFAWVFALYILKDRILDDIFSKIKTRLDW